MLKLVIKLKWVMSFFIQKRILKLNFVHLFLEQNNADKLNRLEGIKIPEGFDYSKLKSLSYEAKEKLSAIKPVTVSQASRISGVSPNDISVMLVYMGR